jgi:hypothetical protein
LKTKILLLLISIILISISIPIYTSAYWCYQESANTSSLPTYDEIYYSEGVCELNYSGSYSFVNISGGYWMPYPNRIVNGNWSDRAMQGGNDGVDASWLYVNYTKPFFINNNSDIIWRTKVGYYNTPEDCYGKEFNISIPKNCINNSDANIRLAVKSVKPDDTSFYCYNYTDYQFLISLNWANCGNLFYEEGIFWDTKGTFNISIKSENTNDIIIQNVSLVFVNLNNNISTNYNTSIGYIDIYNISSGSFSIYASSHTPTNYDSRFYTFFVESFSEQNLTIYLPINSSTVLFTLLDSEGLTTISDCLVNLYTNINESINLVENHLSDITGRVTFNYIPNTYYMVSTTCTGYEPKSWILNPIVYSSYIIKINKNIASYDGFDDVLVGISHGDYDCDNPNNFTFSITSYSGILNNYGYIISYPDNNSVIYTGNNIYGETSITNFTPTCNSFNDKINISYFYITTTEVIRTNNIVEGLRGFNLSSNYTIKYVYKDKTFGMGDLERIIIITLISIVLGGVIGILGGAIMGLVSVLVIFGFFNYTGFTGGAIFGVIVAMIAGVILWMGGRSTF